MTSDQLASWLASISIAAPALLATVFCVSSLVSTRLSERTTARLTELCVVTGLVTAFGVLVIMLWTGSRHVVVELGNWAAVHDAIEHDDYHFHFKFVFDRLSVPFVLLTYVLVGTVGAFGSRYLHRERGFHRFFAQYGLFLLGMVMAALAGTVETLFFGWELVGLSSALLVGYFHDRPAPVRNAQRVWSVYRFADAAFLVAAVAMHQCAGGGDFSAMMGEGAWPYGHASIEPGAALAIGLLLLTAAAGKSGLLPFSEWVPRAMEGPTPSSAIFYGALSVHLGAYLLLRVSPLLESSHLLQVAVVTLGLASAVYGAVVARAQTDIKTAIAFASVTQVGLITAEIGLGLRYLALVHLVGHACLRTLQLLRAPSLLDDRRTIEDALGGRLVNQVDATELSPFRRWLYRFSLNRGSLDAWIDRLVVNPFISLFATARDAEERWLDCLRRDTPPKPAAPVPTTPVAEAEVA
ncbi:NADH-quinone oxidoreductase subunit 12 [Botrimarina colliarenosi]|uniref:NADH-quinone oxidoreductase subunit 12 n=1 Tax=Botrimarina colliarenosi TaxID=2528001 RepID=A0A5C6AF60_9BACT|nr:proton-conducting transporter membrane subunit [Botrimarina colliarenosi]TWT97958.1 NADH-quinone oxidoreductase subunit 12 [Botrimarina colliarenosi]